jgi:hypothetical protein
MTNCIMSGIQRLILLHDWHQFVTEIAIYVGFKSQSNGYLPCEISGSHCDECEVKSHLGCSTM